MSTATPPRTGRWRVLLLAALAALAAMLLGPATASAAMLSAAETRVGASTLIAPDVVGVAQHIAAGQRRCRAPSQPQIVSGHCVAAEAGAVRGGVGPVSQGAAGVERTVGEIEGAGGRILGREVTVESGGVRTRPDLFVELPNGQQAFIEVRTGASAGLTPNQRAAFPSIMSGGFTPYGANAAGAGLTPGVPYGPIPVWVVRQPWPF